MLSALFLSCAKQAGSGGHLPTHSCLRCWGCWGLGLYQAAPSVCPGLFALGGKGVKAGQLRGCRVGPSWESEVCRHRVIMPHRGEIKQSLPCLQGVLMAGDCDSVASGDVVCNPAGQGHSQAVLGTLGSPRFHPIPRGGS